MVRLELRREDTGNSLDAEISRERFRELDLRVGDKVDVIARNLRVFADEDGVARSRNLRPAPQFLGRDQQPCNELPADGKSA